MDLKREARGAGEKIVVVGLTTATAALIKWIGSRPIKRLIQKRRARVEKDREDG